LSKSHDLIHRTLVFFNESSQRLNILKRSQIAHETSKEGKEIFFYFKKTKEILKRNIIVYKNLLAKVLSFFILYFF